MRKIVRHINDETSFSFKVVVPVMTAILTMSLWLNNTLQQIKAENREQVTRSELALWRNELAEKNPSIKVPFTPTTLSLEK